MSIKIIFLTLIALFFSTVTNASMTISGTRIIFPGKDREVSVRTNNKGTTPSLVQVWVDDGNANGDINKMKIPFVVTPAVYRVEPTKGQSVRMIYNGMVLPQDKESVYWFNLLEIPPVSKNNANESRLELAFRTRIKVFYRPDVLKSSSSKQLSKLQWQAVMGGKKGKGIKVTNPTSYYMSFSNAQVKVGGALYRLDIDMVAPFSSAEFWGVKPITSEGSISQISYRLLNDFGAGIDGVLYATQQGFRLEKDPKKQ
jgi:P pilus assembly chaperone PapD